MTLLWLLVSSFVITFSVQFATKTDNGDGESDSELCMLNREGLCDFRYLQSLVSVTDSREESDCDFLTKKLACLDFAASKCPKSTFRHSLLNEAMEETKKTHSECLNRMEQADAAVADATQGQVTCQPSEVEECLQNVYPFMKNETLSGLSVDRGERDLACSVFKKGMSCIDDYATRCLTPLRRESLERKVWGARQVMVFVCSAKMHEGMRLQSNRRWYCPIQKDCGKRDKNCHRQYTDCFKELTSRVSNCSNSLQKTRIRRPYHSKDESIRDLCCAQRNFLDCVLKDAHKVCEDSAIDLASKIFKSMYTPQLNRKCTALKVLDCSSGTSYKRARDSMLVFVLLLIVRAVHLP